MIRAPSDTDGDIVRDRKASSGIAPPAQDFDQRIAHLNLVELQKGEPQAYAGKGKSRALDVDSLPELARKEQLHDQGSSKDESVGTSFPLNSVGSSPVDDTEFERRQYRKKKLHRLQLKARLVCKAVRCERCRVHGILFRDANAIMRRQGNAYISMGYMSIHGFVDEMFQLDDSVGPCVTVFDDSDLAKVVGQAAEIRKRDGNTLICVEGLT